ncbi:MAG: polyprenyl diphosphate synthase, partial [Myxococcota bacterium]|nr:polyprenyl diphosphate synthase [Myxococcota bacterium]
MGLLSHVRLPAPIADVAYRAYERRLLNGVRSEPVPGHVGVIMDGNRRLAKTLGMTPWDGHELGSRTVESLVDWSRDVGVRTLTLYAFSTENFDRVEEEVDALMGMFATKLTQLATDRRILDNRVRVRVLGRNEMLPERVRAAIETVESATGSFDDYHLNFCIAYGGRQEIIDAVRCLIDKVSAGTLDADD